MPSTGWINATAQSNDTLASTTWSNQANILDQDDDEATEAITAKNTPGTGSTTTGWLKAGTFGFDSLIPSGRTIQAISIRVRSRVNSAGGIANREMCWAVSGTRGTNTHASATEPTTLETVDTDVTGERSWTRADLLNGTFEVHVRGRNGNSTTDPSYRFAYVAVNVTYSDEYTDSGTVTLVLTPSGTEFPAVEYTDTQTVTLTLTAGGTDELVGGGTEYTDSGTVYLNLDPVPTPPSLTIVDEFNRTVAAGANWGTPDVGGNWTRETGTGNTYSVSGGRGLLTPGLDETLAIVSGSNEDDFDAYLVFRWTDEAAGGTFNPGSIIARYVDGSNYYQAIARILHTTPNSLRIEIRRHLAGVSSSLGGTVTVDAAFDPGDYWVIRFQGVGQTLRAKLWKLGTAEPSAWHSVQVDASHASGALGFKYSFSSGNTVSPTIEVDRFLVYNGPVSEEWSGADTGTIYLNLDPGAIVSYNDRVLSLGANAFYPLNDPSGTVAKDISGSTGLDGTYVNTPTLGEPTLTADGEPSVHFNASQDEYITLPEDTYDPGGYNADGITIEAWFKRDTGSSGLDQGIVGAWSGATSGGPMLWLDHVTGNLRGVWDQVSLATYLDAGFQPGDEIIHAVLHYDADADIISLFVNGEEVDSATGVTSLGLSDNWAIGIYNDDTALTFAGWIAKVAIYSYAIGAAEIAENYRVGVGEGVEFAEFADSGTVYLTLTPGEAYPVHQQLRATVTLKNDDANQKGVDLRLRWVGSPTFNGYVVSHLTDSTSAVEDTWVISRMDGGTETALNFGQVSEYVVGDIIGAEIDGNTITAFRIRGGVRTNLGTANDSTYKTGTYDVAVDDPSVFNYNNVHAVIYGPEYAEFVDTATIQLTLTPSGTDEYTPGAAGTEYTDSGTTYLVLTVSGTEEAAYADSNTVTVAFTPSGAEEAAYVDSAETYLTLTTSGTELQEAVEVATVDLRFTPGGTEEYTGVSHYEDAGTALLAFTVSLAEAYTTVDSDQLYVSLTPGGTDTLEHVTTDEGTATLSLVPSGIEYSEYVDSATASLTFTPSGTDTLETTTATVVTLQLTPSGVDEYDQIGEFEDSGTVYLHLTPISATLTGMQLNSRAFIRYRSRITGRWASRSFKRVLSRL